MAQRLVLLFVHMTLRGAGLGVLIGVFASIVADATAASWYSTEMRIRFTDIGLAAGVTAGITAAIALTILELTGLNPTRAMLKAILTAIGTTFEYAAFGVIVGAALSAVLHVLFVGSMEISRTLHELPTHPATKQAIAGFKQTTALAAMGAAMGMPIAMHIARAIRARRAAHAQA